MRNAGHRVHGLVRRVNIGEPGVVPRVSRVEPQRAERRQLAPDSLGDPVHTELRAAHAAARARVDGALRVERLAQPGIRRVRCVAARAPGHAGALLAHRVVELLERCSRVLGGPRDKLGRAARAHHAGCVNQHVQRTLGVPLKICPVGLEGFGVGPRADAVRVLAQVAKRPAAGRLAAVVARVGIVVLVVVAIIVAGRAIVDGGVFCVVVLIDVAAAVGVAAVGIAAVGVDYATSVGGGGSSDGGGVGVVFAATKAAEVKRQEAHSGLGQQPSGPLRGDLQLRDNG